MNLALKLQLGKAYNYLCACEKYERDWGPNQRQLAVYKNTYKSMSTITLREYRKSLEFKKEEKFKFEFLYLLFPVFLVLAIIPFLAKKMFAFIKKFFLRIFFPNTEERELKKDAKYEYKYQQHMKELEAKIQSLEAEKKELEVLKRRLDLDKECLSFITFVPWRKKEAVKYFYDVVSNGYCNTIQEAMDSYKEYNIIVAEAEQKWEERQEAERRHKETLDQLEKIARNQQDINDRIDYLRRYR